jgi:D-sedoheptulose 7-phosphate isomerase
VIRETSLWRPADVAVVPPALRSRQHLQETLAGRYAHLRAGVDALVAQLEAIAVVAEALVGALRRGHKVLVAGNGGSAAEAQHFAAELVGRFKRERDPFAVLALTSDTAILTAIANDYGYAEVFKRQVVALGRPGDIFVAISTSGTSQNLLVAAETARQGGLTVIAMTGAGPNPLQQRAHLGLCTPGPETAVVQELHMVVTHLLCDLVEMELAGAAKDSS